MNLVPGSVIMLSLSCTSTFSFLIRHGRIVKQLSRQPYGIQPIALALSLAAGHAKARKCGKLT